MSKRSQTPASLRPLRSSLSSCVKILTTREEKKLPKYDDEDDAGYSQPEFSGRRCQKEGLDSRFTKAFAGLAQQLPEDPDDQGTGRRILRILLYVDDYDRNKTLSSSKQCRCGRNEDGWL